MNARTRHGMTSRDLDEIWKAAEILDRRRESIKLAFSERGHKAMAISDVLEALDTMLKAELVPDRKT